MNILYTYAGAMTCVSFDDYKYFSLTFSENFDKRFFAVSYVSY